jgi:hypothetical protein
MVEFKCRGISEYHVHTCYPANTTSRICCTVNLDVTRVCEVQQDQRVLVNITIVPAINLLIVMQWLDVITL